MEQKINSKKHVLIYGKSKHDRHDFLKKILEKENSPKIFFPNSLTDISDYVNFVQSKRLFQPFYEQKKTYNANQILDFHRDWIAENNYIFVFEEIQNIEIEWMLELFRIFINTLEQYPKEATKIFATMEDPFDFLKNLNKNIAETSYKTREQVFQSNLEVINLDFQ